MGRAFGGPWESLPTAPPGGLQEQPSAKTKRRSGGAEKRFRKGLSDLASGNAAAATEWIERTIAGHSRISGHHEKQCESRALLHRLEEAIRSYRRGMVMEPRSAQHHFDLGVALESLEAFDAASVCLGNALKRDPTHALAHWHLARCLLGLGDEMNAIVNFERAVFFDSGLALAHRDLGRAFVRIGAVKAAISSFRRAAELAPQLPEVHFALGRSYAGQSRWLEAVDAFRVALALDPLHAENWSEFGNALAECDGSGESMEICHRLARDRTGTARISGSIFRDLLNLKRTNDAAQWVSAIRELLVQAWIQRCRAGLS